MATGSISDRHVQQVAELVQRLNRNEIRELLRLVPKLQAEAATTDPPADLVQWVGEQMAQYAPKARPMQAEDAFLEDKTVAEYFALPDPERERIWTDLYAEAIESAPEREVEPDAAVLAG
jgi:hypothetical protein